MQFVIQVLDDNSLTFCFIPPQSCNLSLLFVVVLISHTPWSVTQPPTLPPMQVVTSNHTRTGPATQPGSGYTLKAK